MVDRLQSLDQGLVYNITRSLSLINWRLVPAMVIHSGTY